MAKGNFRKRLILVLELTIGTSMVLLAGLAHHVWRTWDKVYDLPVPEVHASTDPAILKRGEYLVYGPAHCVECHTGSFNDLVRVGRGEKVPLKGGTPFPAPGLGVIYSKNLTPDVETGIGRYSDGQIARMMRWSVRPDGRASVQPLMPFHNMSDDDMMAIISFLRQEAPVRNAVPLNDFTLMGKVVKSFAGTFLPRTPETVQPPKVAPEEKPTRERGEYLARYVANCVGCHTPLHDMTFAPTGPEFSGGEEMGPTDLPGADKAIWFRTPNITPAPGGGLLKFPDRQTFVARFKVGGRHHPGTPMPWETFANMSDADIGAIYEFLHSLAAQQGPVGEPTFRKTD